MSSEKLIRNNIANIITILRFLLSIAMIFFEFISLPFMIIYLIAGFSDMLDGFVARRINIQSTLGSRLDTLADIIFFMVCIVKIWQIIGFKIWEIFLIAVILLIKLSSMLINFIISKSPVVNVHSIANKITGLLLFFIPVSINLNFSQYYICLVIIIAIISSSDELIKVTRQ